MIELTADNAAAWLRAAGHVPDVPVSVTALSGGISNVVLRVTWTEAEQGGHMVVKQSLPRLRVADEWLFDRSRIFIERDCIAALAELVPGHSPEIVFTDHENYIIGMTHAPPGGVVWKERKLAGQIDPATAGAAGDLLGTIHHRAAKRADLARAFVDLMPLVQGRIDPYHRATAAANPQIAGRIDEEISRLLETRRTLVHGDYSPKNLLVYGAETIYVLDFEVAHWGDPAFDAAFLISHLLLAGAHLPHLMDRYVEAARRFWSGYLSSAADAAGSQDAVAAELGCLLLARVDGKSKVEYLTDDRERRAVRDFAIDVLASRETRLEPIFDAASTGLVQNGAP